MKREPISDAELRRSKDHLKGSLMLSLESTSSRMSHLARQDIYFDRHDTLDETLARIEAVTADDVQRVAARPVLQRLARGHRARAGLRGAVAAPGSTGSRVIARYTSPEMGRIWSDRRRFETWLAGRDRRRRGDGRGRHRAARGGAGHPRQRGAFDVARIDEIEKATQHDLIAFTTNVAEHVGPSARWLHFGLTSSDVVDTALALQMVEASRPDPRRTRAAAADRPRAAPRSTAARR